VKAKSLFFLGLLPVVVIALSCRSRPSLSTLSEDDTQQNRRIIALNETVANTLLYVNSVQKRLPGGQILAQVNLQNRYAKTDVWAEVKVEFYDENSMLVDETEWINTYFPPLEITTIQGNSIHARAVKHCMLLRNIRNASGLLPGFRRSLFELPGITPEPDDKYVESEYRGQVPANTLRDLRDQHQETTGNLVDRIPPEQRLRIGVRMFTGPAAQQDLCRKTTDNVYSEFTRAGGFRMYERPKQEQLVREFELNQTGLVDPETAKKVGRQKGIDLLVVGSVYLAPPDEQRVDIRVIDLETGEVVIADAMVRAINSRNTGFLVRRVIDRIVEMYYAINGTR